MSAPPSMSTRVSLSAGTDRMTTTTTGSLRLPVFPSLVSSTSIASPVSNVMFSPPPSTYTRLPMGSESVTHTLSTVSQLPPISKFKGEDPDQKF